MTGAFEPWWTVTPANYAEVRAAVAIDHQHEIDWSQGLKAPASADEFAGEYVWVVLNSGMKNTVARLIMDRLWPHLEAHGVVGDTFKHPGKRSAIDCVYADRAPLFQDFLEANAIGPQRVVEWCCELPWIGGITKYHLAKNLGVDCAKPDRHLERVAQPQGITPQQLCEQIAASHGDRIATVDLVIWRACEQGIVAPLGASR